MTGYFSLWDVGSGNFIAEFVDGSSALRLVAGLLEANGAAYANDLDLAWISADDESQHVATGSALLALVQKPAPSRRAPRRPGAVRRRRHIIRVGQQEPIASE